MQATIRWIITRRGRFTTHMRFQAEDEAGQVVAQSEVFDGDYTGVHRHKASHAAAHAALVAQLERAGWRPAGQGDRWYEARFER